MGYVVSCVYVRAAYVRACASVYQYDLDPRLRHVTPTCSIWMVVDLVQGVVQSMLNRDRRSGKKES